MISRIALASLATALAVSLSAAAMAQAPTPPPGAAPAPTVPAIPAPSTPSPSATEPANADDCIKAAFDLAQAAEDKKLADDKLEKIDELLTRMETHCDARQFTEAMAVGRDIRTILDQP